MRQALETSDLLGAGWRHGPRISHFRAVTTGTVLGTGVRLVAVGATTVLSFASAHILGVAGTGELLLAIATVWIVAVIARLGLDSVVVRRIAVYRSLGNRAGMRGVARFGTAMVLCSALVATATVFLSAEWIASNLFHSAALSGTIRAASFAIVPLALTILVGEMLRGIERPVRSQLLQGVLIPLGTVAGMLLLGLRYGSQGAAVAFAASCSLAALTGLYFWVAATPELRRVQPEYEVDQILRGAMHQFPYQCLVMLMNWAPFIFLGMLASTRETGVFGIAWRLSLFVGIVPLALDAIAAPRVAALHAIGDHVSLRWLYQTATLALMAVTLPVAAGFALFRGELIALFGDAFQSGSIVLLTLVLFRLVAAAMGPTNVALIMTGHERSIRNVLFVAAVCLVIGNTLLIKTYGALGAAWASGGALAVASCLGALAVRRHLGFWPLPQLSTVVRDLLSVLRSGKQALGQ